MEPTVDKITLVEDARFDSPKSMFLGRVMGNSLINPFTVHFTSVEVFYTLVSASSEVGDIDYEIQRHNAPGFIGCISGVRYNVYAPLKALFRPNETEPPVTTQGYVSESNCGAFPPVLGYVPWEVDPWFTGIGELILILFVSFHDRNIIFFLSTQQLFICVLQSIFISTMTWVYFG